MAENAPPATTAAANAAADVASRGMPYYERLRRDLRESLQKKRQIDANLVCMETAAS
jgi:chromatin modification-related protein EAF6